MKPSDGAGIVFVAALILMGVSSGLAYHFDCKLITPPCGAHYDQCGCKIDESSAFFLVSFYSVPAVAGSGLSYLVARTLKR